MSSPQEQYAEALRTSQDAVIQAVQSWTKAAGSAFGQEPATPAGRMDTNQVIDQVFDFAERMLEVQREFAKSLAASAASAAQGDSPQSESAQESDKGT